MKVRPLAADSLGARSMATFVETKDVRVLLDPGVRLGPWRYDLPPHDAEKRRQKAHWQEIRRWARKADILTVSHFHYDHHNPDAPSIYRGKTVYLKDGTFHINRSQRARSNAFLRVLRKYPERIAVADGAAAEFGDTELAFSPAVPHGFTDELGYVVMTRVSDGNTTFLHTSDVEGPPLKAHLSFILDSDPDILYVDGPMTHMPERYPEAETRRSIRNLLRILRATRVRTLILDHHALRDRDWMRHLAPVLEAGSENDVTVQTAAQFAGKPIEALEANRDRLYGARADSDPKPI